MKSKTRLFLIMALVTIFITGFMVPLGSRSGAVLAATPDAVIDDFEDGDASDWGFFGGNAAGGGGGALSDRPQEGSFYLSTGWGGDGSNSVFYGGFFKNFDNATQPAAPADPWFNVWVLNQSDATVSQYTLEITLREDLNGDGWTDGAEDSFRLDTVFTSASFDDQWTLVSAPLSGFTDLATGGDGSFNGNLDEVVVVVSGVAGAPGSTVEVDFDQLSFTAGGPLGGGGSLLVFDDMEHGDPFGNGWFAFGGAVGGGGIAPNTADLPPSNGGVFSLETGWGSGGVPGFFGGFGRTNLLDLSTVDTFSFWINPDAGQDYTLEINLQEDDTGDDLAETAVDDEFQFNCVVSAAGPCAISGGGWQQVSIPLADFFDDNSFFTGGNGVLDAVSVANGGNGQLVNIVIAVIGNSGSDVNFRTDYWVFSSGTPNPPSVIIDDFENGLPSGVNGDGVSIGFVTFSDGSPISIAITDAPSAPVPGSAAGNNVLAMTGDVTAFAGFVHAFENETVDTWVPQDWSSYEGFSFWLYGLNTGTGLFVDIIDNRNPGSTTDDAERFSVALVDDFSGWKLFEIPFASFVRKDIGNGAPNDGFTLTQVHGWAFGTLNTGSELTYFVDDAAVYGVAEIPALAVTFASARYEVDEGTTGNIVVKLNRPMNSDDPAQVSVDYTTEVGSATPGKDYNTTSGTLTFVNGGPSELTFPLETLEDTKFEGDESVILRLSNPVDVAEGFSMQAGAFIQENDPYDKNLLDDFEKGDYLWETNGLVGLETAEITAADSLAIPGQDAFETVLNVAPPVETAPRVALETAYAEVMALIPSGNAQTDKWLQRTLIQLERSLLPQNWQNDYYLDATYGSTAMSRITQAVIFLELADNAPGAPVSAIQAIVADLVSAAGNLAQLQLDLAIASNGAANWIRQAQTQMDGAADALAKGNNATAVARYGVAWLRATAVFSRVAPAPATFSRDFALGQNWSNGEALTFWYYGSNSGDEVTVNLKENRAADPGPAGWSMVWSEEFNEPVGTPPNPEYWSYEIGDGTVNGIPGWGNDEFQYYTDDPANAATDGNGNMVLTVREADGSLDCYYGPCEYTSARLISWRKAEFAYGRIESRILVPSGEAGLWPAFWSLGTDIDAVPWPQTGEIDFMEYVSRLPNEIFGTVHGPGYSGGQSFGNVYDFGGPVSDNYHTFTIEWQPNRIDWYVDGILYHTATPADVSGEWVFNDPVYLLLNVAIGGNFGGTVDPNLQLPQSMAVDYIRVYQGPDTAERFETSFVDNFTGWQQVEIPFTSFARSAEQPAGAPDDGLSLEEVWGYGFSVPAGTTTSLDQVRVKPLPPPTELTVTTLTNSGDGSLRDALTRIAPGGTISFDPALAGGTVALNGPIVPSGDVVIDATAAPGISLNGGGIDRVFIINAGTNVTIKGLTLTNGYGFQLAGGVLNNGALTLENSAVTGNTMTTDAGDFWQGGGGIYSGDGASLTLIDSTVSDNSSGWTGGGIYSFFNTTTTLIRSTVSGNVSADVGGGMRTLGNGTIENSTISGNTSTAWHGGAAFITDGVVNITNSTVTGNSAPAGTAGGLFVGTFTDASATLNIQNSIVAANGDFGCFLAPFGGGAVALNSLGNNVFTDGTCANVASDQVVGDALLGLLADNGGPTLTHALLAGSPAIDAANTAVCPVTDQRGVARDAACDIGAFEFVP